MTILYITFCIMQMKLETYFLKYIGYASIHISYNNNYNESLINNKRISIHNILEGKIVMKI